MKFDCAVAVLSMLVAVVLLIVSVVALYVVTNANVRLGLVCLFAALFAVTVNTMSNARRAELFASTAASVFFKFLVAITNEKQVYSSACCLREWEVGIAVS